MIRFSFNNLFVFQRVSLVVMAWNVKRMFVLAGQLLSAVTA